ncbi:hypothetical protein NUSPORA_02195 [Nucleospora cyclopteri]
MIILKLLKRNFFVKLVESLKKCDLISLKGNSAQLILTAKSVNSIFTIFLAKNEFQISDSFSVCLKPTDLLKAIKTLKTDCFCFSEKLKIFFDVEITKFSTVKEIEFYYQKRHLEENDGEINVLNYTEGDLNRLFPNFVEIPFIESHLIERKEISEIDSAVTQFFLNKNCLKHIPVGKISLYAGDLLIIHRLDLAVEERTELAVDFIKRSNNEFICYNYWSDILINLINFIDSVLIEIYENYMVIIVTFDKEGETRIEIMNEKLFYTLNHL